MTPPHPSFDSDLHSGRKLEFLSGEPSHLATGRIPEMACKLSAVWSRQALILELVGDGTIGGGHGLAYPPSAMQVMVCPFRSVPAPGSPTG